MPQAEQISRRLKLRQLNILLAVARCGSMAKAADELAITQPVISKAIAELEHLLGVRLLDRGRYGIEPTLHGRALLRRSVAIFDDLKTSVSELEFLSDPTAGHLRIGCDEPLSTWLFPVLIDRLARRYPRLTYEIVIADPKTLRERDLRGRNIEVAIMRTQDSDRNSDHDEGLETRMLYRDRLWVVAGTRSPWAKRRKIALADLINERWCLPAPDHPVGALVVEAFRQSGLELPKRSITVGSAQFTSNLLAKGRFLGVHGTTFLRFLPPSVRLKILPVDLPVPETAISLVALKDRTLSPVARLFVDWTHEFTRSLAPK
jgi:DNA-binding transcriptional LysR family regulator